MPIPLIQVDAFTATPFAGNPAAVCLLDRPAPAPWMQHVAAEMNLAETAFLVPAGGDSFGLRWFTPTVEVDLCGHATLASAHVLWETGRLDRSSVARFSTRSGVLTARLGAAGWITLDFPALPSTPVASPPRAALAAALGIDPAEVVAASRGRDDLIVEVTTAAVVRAIRPDFGLLGAIDARGIIATSRADPELAPVDFTSRFFGPRVGVPEDPVTGSAHCALGPYWAPRIGRTALLGHQDSRRGGAVRVEVAGDRVQLGGQAVTVLRGELTAAADPA